MHFGENELSPGSIGFSPLNLPHPPTFQRRWVRTSTVSYHSFILDRLRSPGFASTLHDSCALFRLGFPSATDLAVLNLATHNNSPAHFTKGIPSHTPASENAGHAPIACRHTGSGLFHSPPGVLFTFPSRYSSLSVIRHI